MINNYPQPAAPAPGQPYYPPPPGYAPQPGYAPLPGYAPQPGYAAPPAYGYPPAPPPAAPQQSQVFQPNNTINIVNSAAPVVEKKPKKKVIKTNTYPSTVASGQRSPTWITCPYCRKNGLTKCEFVAGDAAWCWAFICCAIGLGPCWPFMMDDFKDCQHSCPHCGQLVGTVYPK